MQYDKHPKYGLVPFKFPNGEVIEMNTTLSGRVAPERLPWVLDTHPSIHPAWNRGMKTTMVENDKTRSFRERYKRFVGINVKKEEA